MLGILKVNAGINTDGGAEFSMSIVDEQDHVYEVALDDRAYAQIVNVIEEVVSASYQQKPEMENPPEPPQPKRISEERREMLTNLLACSGAPEHMIEGDAPVVETPKPAGGASMADVGFIVDYSAEMDDYDEEEDPGEDLFHDDEHSEPL